MSEVTVMVKVLRELAGQGALSADTRTAASDAASFIEAVTSAVFDSPGREPRAVVDTLKAIYVQHRFG